jgi:hypothetical protein
MEERMPAIEISNHVTRLWVQYLSINLLIADDHQLIIDGLLKYWKLKKQLVKFILPIRTGGYR